MTPREAMNKGNYKQAFRLAKRNYRKGKNKEENLQILREASMELVADKLDFNYDLEQSSDVKDWIKAQNKYYTTLDMLGKTNKLVEGGITNSYDQLCEVKKELDFKIVDYYYQKAENYMIQYDKSTDKVYARNAYYEFINAEKHGAQIFYSDIISEMEEAQVLGIVYYYSPDAYIGTSLFLKPLPESADFEPDCEVEIRYGYIDFDEHTDTDVDHYHKKIQVDTEEHIDTAGVVTVIPIFEEVEAEVQTTEVTLTAEQSISLFVNDITGQCTLDNYEFNVEVSDSYKEVEVFGDDRALNCIITEQSGSSLFFESDLEDDLRNEVQWQLKRIAN